MNRPITAAAALAACALAAAAQAAAFDPQAATEAYLASVAGEARAKSDAYFEGGYWLILWDALYGIGVAALLLWSGVSTRLRGWTERIVRRPWLQRLIFGALLLAASALLTFPMTLWESYFREHAYGLSNQTLGAWFGEWLTGQAVGLVFGAIFVAVLYGIVRRAPRTWALWGAVFTAGFLAVSVALVPVFVAPLFNDYKSMRDGDLKQSILSLARANGIPADDVWEFDASKQSKRISANVSGFLGTMRISLNDNLLERATPAEVRAVMGHEMGHYVLNHVGKMIVALALVVAAVFAFIHWGFGALHRRFGARWGVRDVADPAGLPVFMLLAAVVGLPLTPVQNTLVRTQEAEADIFGLNAAREPDGFATVSLKLGEYRKLDPTPLEEFIFFDHPSGRSRISMAMRWKAENLGGASTDKP